MVRIKSVIEDAKEVYLGDKLKSYLVYSPDEELKVVGIFLSFGNTTKMSVIKSVSDHLASKGYSSSVYEIVSYYDKRLDIQVSFKRTENPSQYLNDSDSDSITNSDSLKEAIDDLKQKINNTAGSTDEFCTDLLNIYRLRRLIDIYSKFESGEYNWNTDFVSVKESISVMGRLKNYSSCQFESPYDNTNRLASLKIGVFIDTSNEQ